MTATASCCSSPVAWARPRAAPASASAAALRVGRCPAVAVAVAAPDVAFHPDVSRAAESLQAEFRAVDRAIALNSSRVAAAFRRARVAPHVTPLPLGFSPYYSSSAWRPSSVPQVNAESSHVRCVRLFQHFGGSTGYGHDDGGGREALDSVFADIVGAEAAIVRPQVRPPHTTQSRYFWSTLTGLLSSLTNQLIAPLMTVLFRYSRHCMCAVCASEAWA